MPIRERHSIHLMVVAAVIGAVAILYSPLSQALRPTVTWTPSILVETLAPGTTKTISVSFRSKKNIQNVAVTVAPSLQPFVQPDRPRFKKIPGKKIRHLGFVVSIPAGTPSGSHTGTIQLVRKKGNRTLRTPLNLTINIGPPGLPPVVPPPVPIEPPALPPDPGEEGKATLEGIDSDGDGVRDDVQRYIALTVTDSARHREALRAVAASLQRGLLAATKQDAIHAAISLSRSIECLSFLGKLDSDRWKEVQTLMLNTEARLSAIDVYNDRITGQVFESLPDSQKRSACTFDVEALPN